MPFLIWNAPRVCDLRKTVRPWYVVSPVRGKHGQEASAFLLIQQR